MYSENGEGKRMKIVIDIPEKYYKEIKDNYFGETIGLLNIMIMSIVNGIPLPKGHGKIGDLDKIKKEMKNYYDDCAKTSEYTRLGFETAMAVVEDAPIIIEAESEETE